MELSIVIPVFCSEKILKELHEEIKKNLVQINIEYEIIYVDDASNDNSWQKIIQIINIDNNTIGIKLNKNYGQHNALFCGIKNSNGKYIVTIDDDLQHPVKNIKDLITKIKEGYDVVYANPIKIKQHFIRNLFSKGIKNIMQYFMGLNINQNIDSFRIFKKDILLDYFDYKNSNINIDVLLSWSTDNFSSIKIEHQKRKKGKSGYSIKKLYNHAIKMITGFSNIPLRISSFLGFIFAIFGFFILVYVLTTYFILGSPVRGFPFIASLISIFSGVQLLTLGIIGEYLSTIHSNSISKPVFKIKEIINNTKS